MYDQTIPIVAAQLLFTVGVTCALAFELPSEPLYHITQKLRNNLLGIPDQAEEETTAAPAPEDSHENGDVDPQSRVDYNYNNLNYIDYNKDKYFDMNKHNYYYSSNYNKHYHNPNNYISDKSDNYFNQFDKSTNQSSIFVTPKPLNQTLNVWTSLVKT